MSRSSGEKLLFSGGAASARIAPALSLSSPLWEFDGSGLLFSSSKQIEHADARLKALEGVPSEFLSVQAEMLTFSKQVEKKRELYAAFEGLELTTVNDRETGCPGVYDPDITQKITINVKTKLDFADTLAHEMTHALDDAYDGRNSGVRVTNLLKFHNDYSLTDGEFQKKVINCVSNVMPESIGSTFRELYISDAVEGVPFVEACESAERKHRTKPTTDLDDQEKVASNLSIEFASFSFETLFSEIRENPRRASDFLKKYREFTPTLTLKRGRSVSAPKEAEMSEEAKAKQKAQEVIAVAMYEIADHMIKSIEMNRSGHTIRSPAHRGQLLIRLKEVRATIEPAYDRVQHIIHPRITRSMKMARGASPRRSSEVGTDVAAFCTPIDVLDMTDVKRRQIAETGRRLFREAMGMHNENPGLVDNMRTDFNSGSSSKPRQFQSSQAAVIEVKSKLPAKSSHFL